MIPIENFIQGDGLALQKNDCIWKIKKKRLNNFCIVRQSLVLHSTIYNLHCIL